MNKKFLFFDTETTGLPKNYDAPVSDTRNWPRIVQISWIIADEQGKLLSEEDFIVRPSGFVIPFTSERIHGISTEKAMNDGHPLKEVMTKFIADIQACDVIVGHNVEFDIHVSGCEAYRLGLPDPFKGKRIVCTMQESTEYCAIPSWYDDEYKWPKLQELHEILFGHRFTDAHNSKADIEATERCFWELVKRGIIEL